MSNQEQIKIKLLSVVGHVPIFCGCLLPVVQTVMNHTVSRHFLHVGSSSGMTVFQLYAGKAKRVMPLC